MNEYETNKPTGSLKISKEVIATIAQTAAKEIAGVTGLATTAADFAGWVMKRGAGRAVAITLTEDTASIDMNLVLAHTAKIQEVAAKVQLAVKDTVQNMTGIAVSKVNIYVAGISFNEPTVATNA